MQLPDDTIAAIVTPPGVGGVGVIRISGPDAFLVAASVVNINEPKDHVAYHAWLKDGLDETIVTFFESPHSFTGEDTVEISCHGSPALLGGVLKELISSGARQAMSGEFSKRAFLNGKIDLIQAEAINNLILSQTGGAAARSVAQLEGALSARIVEIREGLIQALTALQGSMDFPDDIEAGGDEYEAIEKGLACIEGLLSTADYGMALRHGITAVIIGKPNVGKSSMMNALLKEERALVYREPGTTRDAIEEGVGIDGILFKLVDTAGIREAASEIERMGIERGKRRASVADVVIKIYDASTGITADDQEIIRAFPEKGTIEVMNKADLLDGKEGEGDERFVFVSAKTGGGIGELEKRMVRLVVSGGVPSEAVIINTERQIGCLEQAKRGLRNCVETIRMNGEAELVSADLQEAIQALSEMLGAEVGDEVVNRLFSGFCVGK